MIRGITSEPCQSLEEYSMATISKVKTIGVLTSGGDAPGMNAAIRAGSPHGDWYKGMQMKGILKRL